MIVSENVTLYIYISVFKIMKFLRNVPDEFETYLTFVI